MLSFDLKTGYSCNNRCRHCVIDDSRLALKQKKMPLDLSTEECLEKIQDASEMGATNIVLTGGEVSIRKDIEVLIRACADRHMAITLQTNGRRLRCYPLKPLLEAGMVSRCIVALHGATPSIHDHITQVEGSFSETLESLKFLVDNNVTTVLKIVISKLNMPELASIAHLAADTGIKYLCYAFPHAHGAARQNYDQIIPSYSILTPYLREITRISDINNIIVEFEAIPFCVVPFAIHMVGEIKYYTGKVVCSPVREELFNWNMVRPSIKYKPKSCSTCDFDEFCEGVWEEYTKILENGELVPLRLPEGQRSHLKEIMHKLKMRYACGES